MITTKLMQFLGQLAKVQLLQFIGRCSLNFCRLGTYSLTVCYEIANESVLHVNCDRVLQNVISH